MRGVDDCVVFEGVEVDVIAATGVGATVVVGTGVVC